MKPKASWGRLQQGCIKGYGQVLKQPFVPNLDQQRPIVRSKLASGPRFGQANAITGGRLDDATDMYRVDQGQVFDLYPTVVHQAALEAVLGARCSRGYGYATPCHTNAVLGAR